MNIKVLGVFLAAATLGGSACGPAVYGPDPYPIMSRYEMSYTGECSSWLYSHRSGQRYCASPPLDMQVALLEQEGSADAGPRFDESKTDKASLMAAGETLYGEVCAVCHQANGEGQGDAFPPLAGAGDFYGGPENHARIIVHGLSGEIVVKGKTYNSAMPAQGGQLSDWEVAAVATFERNSWGNADGVVLPKHVAAVR